jgi:hypothetical protein
MCREIDAEVAGVDQVVNRLPVATVEHRYDRVRPATGRHAQVGELERLRPVDESCVGVWRGRLVEDLAARSRHAPDSLVSPAPFDARRGLETPGPERSATVTLAVRGRGGIRLGVRTVFAPCRTLWAPRRRNPCKS